MLEILYNKRLQVIELSITDNFHLWPDVRRAFEENAQELSITSASTLRVPVWAFLSSREQLQYVLRKHRIQIDIDPETRAILERALRTKARYDDAKDSRPIDVKDVKSRLTEIGFKRQLTEHQLRNVSSLVALPSGATFSVPGAGKTTEALAFYFYKRTDDARLLVVSPKNAFAAWEEQIELCLQNPPKVTRLTGGEQAIDALLEKDPEVMLITYNQLPNVKGLIASFMAKHPTFMFLDESHRIKKGASGLWASTVLSLSHLPPAKLIMSGTPLPNQLEDLIPQFDFLFPEVVAEPETISDLIKPVFVRTTKAELALPGVKRMLIPIQLRPKQRHLYELMRSEEALQIEKLKSRERIKLRAFGRSVMRLLQLVSNPALLARADVDFPSELYEVLAEGDSPKVEYTCQRARQLAQRGQKTIIWSNFVQNVESIAERLVDLGADYIHGGVDAGSEEEADTRERKIKRFHDDDQAFVLVANPAACAEGISLHTVCHHAIYVDRNYNAAQYLQSEDRIHRLGLPSHVVTNIEILHCLDTIDESVQCRLTIKVDRMARVLNDPSLNFEPVKIDLDEDGLDSEDIQDYIKHLRRL